MFDKLDKTKSFEVALHAWVVSAMQNNPTISRTDAVGEFLNYYGYENNKGTRRIASLQWHRMNAKLKKLGKSSSSVTITLETVNAINESKRKLNGLE
jgi:hypothetical protein